MAMRQHIEGNCSSDFALSGNFPLGSVESRQYISLDQLQQLLQESDVDSKHYIARYFEVYNPSMPVLDSATFQDKVNRFRDAPTTADASWLAQYLVILGLGAYAATRDEATSARYFYASEACLARTPYMFRPSTTTISTLCLMVLAKHIAYATCWALDTSWNVMGVIVRLSMMMMLHQDWMPEFAEPAIANEREYRRRLWTVVVYMDIQMSLITGQQSLLPQNVLLVTSERQTPEILEDCFDCLLPQAFPTICHFLARINSQTDPITYEDVLQYDLELRRLMHQFVDLPGDETLRLNLDLFFRRAISVLHRRHAVDADAPSLYPMSYWSSLDCNLAMLVYHRNFFGPSEQLSDTYLVARPYMLDFSRLL